MHDMSLYLTVEYRRLRESQSREEPEKARTLLASHVKANVENDARCSLQEAKYEVEDQQRL